MEDWFKADIIPSEKDKGFLKRFFKLPHYKQLFKPQFVLCVLGCAGSGKSSWMYSLINKWYKSYFDLIIIITATADSVPEWQKLNTKHRKVKVTTQYNEDEMNEFIKVLEETQEQRRHKKQPLLNVLLFLDDCGAKGAVSKYKPTTITHILNNRRHWNLNLAMTFQSYMQAPQDFRMHQCSQVVVLQVNGLDLDKVATEHGGLATPEEIKAWFHGCKSEDQFKPFIIDYQRKKNERYRCGFTKFYTPGANIEIPKELMEEVAEETEEKEIT